MRISDALKSLAVVLVLGTSGPVAAFEIKGLASDAPPGEALRVGLGYYRSGDTDSAIAALSYAADKGLTSAQWKLAEMYSSGDGVEHDDYHAFELFSQLADAHADEGPNDPSAPFVSNAFVRLGAYYRNGIANSRLQRNPVRAREVFTYAASYFGDPSAQASLAGMYYGGEGGERDLIQAAKWANLAADNGNKEAVGLLIDISVELARTHLDGDATMLDLRQAMRWARVAAEYGDIEGQALLGKLLFDGDGVSRQPVEGLMYLIIAATRDPGATWILDLQAQALSVASDADRTLAMRRAEDWLAKHPAQLAAVTQ